MWLSLTTYSPVQIQQPPLRVVALSRCLVLGDEADTSEPAEGSRCGVLSNTGT